MWLDDLAAHLASEGHGSLPGTIFVGTVPASPDALVAVLMYPGLAPERVHDVVGPAYHRPRFQLWVRDRVSSSGYSTAYDRIHAAYQDLDAVRNQTLGATRFLSITALQSPFEMPIDRNNRPQFVCNFQVVWAAP